MKASILLLFLLPFLILSCGNDALKLTNDNHLYELDLHKKYLIDKLDATAEEINKLELILSNNQGDSTTIDLLNQTKILEEKLQIHYQRILADISEIDPPKPPCPDLTTPDCNPPQLRDLKFILLEKNLTSALVKIENPSGEIIYQNAEIDSLPNLTSGFNVLEINLNEAALNYDQFNLIIEKTGEDDAVIIYNNILH